MKINWRQLKRIFFAIDDDLRQRKWSHTHTHTTRTHTHTHTHEHRKAKCRPKANEQKQKKQAGGPTKANNNKLKIALRMHMHTHMQETLTHTDRPTERNCSGIRALLFAWRKKKQLEKVLKNIIKIGKFLYRLFDYNHEIWKHCNV